MSKGLSCVVFRGLYIFVHWLLSLRWFLNMCSLACFFFPTRVIYPGPFGFQQASRVSVHGRPFLKGSEALHWFPSTDTPTFSSPEAMSL